ncbi:hypothetical protein BGW38_010002, partial [Lunasporangiospora selenospora]
EDRDEITKGLQKTGWIAHRAPGEADVAVRLRHDCLTRSGQSVLVVSGDSDFLAHRNIGVVFRPTGSKFKRYDVDDCAKALGLSRAQLTALAVVSLNDYSDNAPGLGTKSNLDIIRELSHYSSVSELVDAYGRLSRVSKNASRPIGYSQALLVYEHGQELMGDPEEAKISNGQAVLRNSQVINLQNRVVAAKALRLSVTAGK